MEWGDVFGDGENRKAAERMRMRLELFFFFLFLTTSFVSRISMTSWKIPAKRTCFFLKTF